MNMEGIIIGMNNIDAQKKHNAFDIIVLSRKPFGGFNQPQRFRNLQ